MAVLFISRGTMSGVSRLVACFAEHSAVRLVSREELVEVVDRHGEFASRVVEQLASADRAYEQFSRSRHPYLVLMRQGLLEQLRGDGIIYHGYSGHLLLPPLPHFVRVRIEAPLSVRVPLTMERLGCTEEAAREYIREEDTRRVRWARFMYGRDIRDPQLYDLVLNLERISLETACHTLLHVLESPELMCSEESRLRLESMRRAAAVEAALVSDPRTYAYEVGAQVEDGSARLTGPYLEQEAREVVREIVLSIPGIESVDYAPGYAPFLGAIS